MRRSDLAVRILDQHRERTVQHAGLPRAERCGVLAARDPAPGCFHTDQADAGLADERVEDPHRVRATADARGDDVGEPALPLEDLRARLFADHLLELTDEQRERMWPNDGADHVVRGLDVRHPVAERLVDRVLQRSRPRRHRHDRCPQELHPEDVQRLAMGVFLTHVDDALLSEQGRGRGGRYPVLPGARLRDDPLLAHPAGEQALTEHIIDLVRAGVREVLTLEVDARAAARFGQPARAPERRRPACVLAAQRVELGIEIVVCARVGEGLLELIERVHERFGNVLAAEAAEVTAGVGICVHARHRARSLAASPWVFRRKNRGDRARGPHAQSEMIRTRSRRWWLSHRRRPCWHRTSSRRCRTSCCRRRGPRSAAGTRRAPSG